MKTFKLALVITLGLAMSGCHAWDRLMGDCDEEDDEYYITNSKNVVISRGNATLSATSTKSGCETTAEKTENP